MSLPTVEVYSCVTGSYDNISRTLLASDTLVEPNVSFTIYSDKFEKAGTHLCQKTGCCWNLKPLEWENKLCKKRTARWHKVNSHLVSKADYTVWVDGSQRSKKIGFYKDLVSKLSNDLSLFSFKHPQRSCVYQEMHACSKLNKDNPKLMRNQMERYRSEGYPAYNGLVETACVVRKNCKEVTAFNKSWWEELEKGSFRDQLSFNYAANLNNLSYGFIPGCRVRSPFFDFVQHGR